MRQFNLVFVNKTWLPYQVGVFREWARLTGWDTRYTKEQLDVFFNTDQISNLTWALELLEAEGYDLKRKNPKDRLIEIIKTPQEMKEDIIIFYTKQMLEGNILR